MYPGSGPLQNVSPMHGSSRGFAVAPLFRSTTTVDSSFGGFTRGVQCPRDLVTARAAQVKTQARGWEPPWGRSWGRFFISFSSQPRDKAMQQGLHVVRPLCPHTAATHSSSSRSSSVGVAISAQGSGAQGLHGLPVTEGCSRRALCQRHPKRRDGRAFSLCWSGHKDFAQARGSVGVATHAHVSLFVSHNGHLGPTLRFTGFVRLPAVPLGYTRCAHAVSFPGAALGDRGSCPFPA